MAESFICDLFTGGKDRLDLPGYQLPCTRNSYVQWQRECIGSWNTKLAVLATGMDPAAKGQGAAGAQVDDNGFIVTDSDKAVFSAGCAKKASDVVTSTQNATAAALKAIQASRR